jgi:hypothetical protein
MMASPNKKASPAVAPGGSENNKQQDRSLFLVLGYWFLVLGLAISINHI